MKRHFIILSSAYSKGKRIALDFIDTKELSKIERIINEIKNKCGNDVSISFHNVESKDTTWLSVGQSDPFFANVELIVDEDEFIKLIKKDRKMKGLDIARFILSTVKDCTHLKLEKLVYLCYADYLCKTQGKDKLFIDKIFAYKYGPVVDSVYKYYKMYSYNKIEDVKMPTQDKFLSARSRILFAENGLMKLKSIMDTLQKYGEFDGGSLINLTHKKDSPWQKTNSSIMDNPIKDDIILQYHCNEVIKNKST